MNQSIPYDVWVQINNSTPSFNLNIRDDETQGITANTPVETVSTFSGGDIIVGLLRVIGEADMSRLLLPERQQSTNVDSVLLKPYMSVAEIRREAHRRAREYEDVPRSELMARFSELVEEIRREAIEKGTAVEEAWLD